jgi:hypothetical protein
MTTHFTSIGQQDAMAPQVHVSPKLETTMAGGFFYAIGGVLLAVVLLRGLTSGWHDIRWKWLAAGCGFGVAGLVFDLGYRFLSHAVQAAGH